STGTLGPSPADRGQAEPNVPSPLPNRTLARLSNPTPPATRSGIPSPFTSPTAHPKGADGGDGQLVQLLTGADVPETGRAIGPFSLPTRREQPGAVVREDEPADLPWMAPCTGLSSRRLFPLCSPGMVACGGTFFQEIFETCSAVRR